MLGSLIKSLIKGFLKENYIQNDRIIMLIVKYKGVDQFIEKTSTIVYL